MKKLKYQYVFSVYVQYRSNSLIDTGERFEVILTAENRDNARRKAQSLLRENWGETFYQWKVDIKTIIEL